MLTVGFNVDGVERVLDLRLNTDLIPVGYQQLHQHRGTYEVHTPSKVVSTARYRIQYSHPQRVNRFSANNVCANRYRTRERNSIGYPAPIKESEDSFNLTPCSAIHSRLVTCRMATQRAALSPFNGTIRDVKFTIAHTAVQSPRERDNRYDFFFSTIIVDNKEPFSDYIILLDIFYIITY